jgi:hypothetical protein
MCYFEDSDLVCFGTGYVFGFYHIKDKHSVRYILLVQWLGKSLIWAIQECLGYGISHLVLIKCSFRLVKEFQLSFIHSSSPEVQA